MSQFQSLQAAVAAELADAGRPSKIRSLVSTNVSGNRLTLRNQTREYLVICRLREAPSGGTTFLDFDGITLSVDARPLTENSVQSSALIEAINDSDPQQNAYKAHMPAPIFLPPEATLVVKAIGAGTLSGAQLSAHGFGVSRETAQYIRDLFGQLWAAQVRVKPATASLATHRYNTVMDCIATNYAVFSNDAAVHDSLEIRIGDNIVIDTEEDVHVSELFDFYGPGHYLEHVLRAGSLLQLSAKPGTADAVTAVVVRGLQR